MDMKAFFEKIGNYFKTMNKDRAIDLAVTIGDIIIWSSPIFIVIYVLVWFLNK